MAVRVKYLYVHTSIMAPNSETISLTKEQRDSLREKERAYSEQGKHRWADRCRAVILRDEGCYIEDISSILGRPYRSVQDWLRLFREEGLRGMEPKVSTRGRHRKLDKHERMLLSKAIVRGPMECGFKGAVWTSPMVAEYIWKRWNIRYHPGHVRKLLHQLGFSVQFPKEKLALADLKAQEKWLNEDLPAIKKKPPRKAPS